MTTRKHAEQPERLADGSGTASDGISTPLPVYTPPNHSDAPTALVAPRDESGSAMFERLSRDPDVSMEKMERLMALWERAEARKAETAFNAAMSEAQTEMRPVAADAANPQTHSKYASYARLDSALRQVYTAHGFALSFDTGDAVGADMVRVLCYVSHSGGFARTYKCDMPADGKGARGNDVMTKTHATGSALTYGMRYLLKMIFNVAVGEDDDDGNRAGKRPAARQAPKPSKPVATHPDSEEVITAAQATRLWTIIRRRGREDAEVKRYLFGQFGIDSTKAIQRKDYETICTAIEHPGPLTVREPGEEG